MFGGEALLREAVGANLAHPHAVAPAAADEYELSYTAFIVVFATDDE